MSRTLSDVFTAIRTALTGDSAVAALIGTRVYAAHRPPLDGATLPRVHVVFVDENVSESGLRRLRIQFSIYTADNDALSAWAISKAIEDVLHSGGLSITGWTCHWIDKQGSHPAGGDEFDVFLLADDYMITLS